MSRSRVDRDLPTLQGLRRLAAVTSHGGYNREVHLQSAQNGRVYSSSTIIANNAETRNTKKAGFSGVISGSTLAPQGTGWVSCSEFHCLSLGVRFRELQHGDSI